MKSLLHNMMICLVVLLFNAQVTTGQWTKLQSTSKSDNFSVEFVNADTGFIAAGNVILKTTNTGVTWTTIPVSNSVRTLSFPTPEVGYAAGKAVYKTVNGGENWDSIYVVVGQSANMAANVVEFVSHNTGYLGASNSAQWSVDGGVTWTVCESTFFGPLLGCGGYAASFASPTLGYVSCWPNNTHPTDHLHVTTNGGQDWSPANQWIGTSGAFGLRISTIYALSAKVTWLGGARVDGFVENSRVFRTTDGGETWDTTSYFFPHTVNTITFANELIGFIGDKAGNIYSTTDGGDTWQNDNVPSNGNSINSITIAGGSVAFAVGNNGLILKRDLPTSIYEESTSSLVQPLFKVYPNPTTGITELHYTISEPCDIEISLVSSHGTTEIVQQHRGQVRGDHTIALDMASLPLGIYYCVVRAGFKVTMKTIARLP